MAEAGKTGVRAGKKGGRNGLHCNVFSWLPNEPLYRL